MNTFRLDRIEINSLDGFISTDPMGEGDIIYWNSESRSPELIERRCEANKDGHPRIEQPCIRTISQDSSGTLVSDYAQISEDPFQYVEFFSRISRDLEEQDRYSAKLREAGLLK